jgi:sodium transport system permease protein
MATERNGSALARIAVVARKEIVDLFRDRRTMLVTLVKAIVAGPVLMLLVLNLVARQADKARELTLPSPEWSARRRWGTARQRHLTPAPARGRIRAAICRARDRRCVRRRSRKAAGPPATTTVRGTGRTPSRKPKRCCGVQSRMGRGSLILRGVAPDVATPQRNARSRHAGSARWCSSHQVRALPAVMGGSGGARHDGGERSAPRSRAAATTPWRHSVATGKWLAVSLLNATAVS